MYANHTTMERWSIKYFNLTTQMWERKYYHTLKDFTTARGRMESDPTKEQLFTKYEKFSP